MNRAFNLIGLTLTVLIAFGAAAYMEHHAPSSEIAVQKDETPAVPDTKFTTIDGRSSSLYALRGKSVVIHYWASWCVPCVKEFPLLAERLKTDDRIAAIAVSVDQDKGMMDDFLNQLPDVRRIENLYIVHDPNRLFSFNGEFVNRFPESFVLDKELNVQNHIEGGIDWRRYQFDP